MVKRQEFEKIIKTGKSLYAIILDRVSKLDRHNTLIYSNAITDMCFNEIDFNKVYKTQAEAEWVSKMHAERTEFFEPSIWEEFEKDPKFSFWVNKFDGLGGLYCIEKTTDIVFDEYGNEVEKEYLDIYATLIENHKTGSGYFYRRAYTKDNYIKACEYARNLFLGKENENETDSDR